MSCPFYGKHSFALMRVLVNSRGNQCALVTDAFAPCYLEIEGRAPDLEKCKYHGTPKAIEFATFETTKMQYPD